MVDLISDGGIHVCLGAGRECWLCRDSAHPACLQLLSLDQQILNFTSKTVSMLFFLNIDRAHNTVVIILCIIKGKIQQNIARR